jgi:cyanophycin synthetase
VPTRKYLPVTEIPLTRNGTIGFQIENAMAAVAATWALNVDWKAIRMSLASFINDAQTAPGRFNMFDYRGASVIADYGHNPDAMHALFSAVESIKANKRVVVISGAGDRRDVDLIRQTEILGDAFDEIILYQDQCQARQIHHRNYRRVFGNRYCAITLADRGFVSCPDRSG